jgi:hypothetical protein
MTPARAVVKNLANFDIALEAFAFADIPAREIAHGQHGTIETHSIV